MSVVAAGLSFVTAAALATALFIDFLLLWFVIVSQGFGVFFDGLGPIAKNTLVPEASQRRRCPRNHGHSATTALLACAIGMGLVSIGTLLLPFMKLLDDKQSPDAVNKRTNFDQYRNKI